MFKNAIQLFEVFGFKLRVDPSWFLIAALIVWSLSSSYFPDVLPGLSKGAYVVLGTVSMLALFASLVLHELSHSLVARSFGLKVGGITLFVFGGVAELEQEPHDPRSEFLIAVAGPVMSFFLAGLFFVAGQVTATGETASVISAVFGYLALINFILALFNLVPAFPLDGGRMLRASIWHYTKDLLRATRIASRFGSVFGIFLMISGVFALLGNQGIGALWQILIGFFVFNASTGSYRSLLFKTILQDKSARSLMSENVWAAQATDTVEHLVNNVMLRHGISFIPVVSGDRLIGYIDTAATKTIDRNDWPKTTLSEVVITPNEAICVAPDLPLDKVFEKLSLNTKRKVLVVDGPKLLGIITLSDVLNYLTVQQDIGEMIALKMPATHLHQSSRTSSK